MPSQMAPLKHRASTEFGEWRNGKMTVNVPVSEAELDWLVAKKYLAEEERENKVAIKQSDQRVERGGW